MITNAFQNHNLYRCIVRYIHKIPIIIVNLTNRNFYNKTYRNIYQKTFTKSYSARRFCPSIIEAESCKQNFKKPRSPQKSPPEKTFSDPRQTFSSFYKKQIHYFMKVHRQGLPNLEASNCSISFCFVNLNESSLDFCG